MVPSLTMFCVILAVMVVIKLSALTNSSYAFVKDHTKAGGTLNSTNPANFL